jgi:hypothetical protein
MQNWHAPCRVTDTGRPSKSRHPHLRCTVTNFSVQRKVNSACLILSFLLLKKVYRRSDRDLFLIKSKGGELHPGPVINAEVVSTAISDQS